MKARTSSHLGAHRRADLHHSQEEILGFFGGLELVPPGVVAVRLWNGDGPALDVQAPTETFIGGVARKP